MTAMRPYFTAFIIVHTTIGYRDDSIDLIIVNHEHRYKERRLSLEMRVVEIVKAIEQEAERLGGPPPVLFIGSNGRSRLVRKLLKESGYPRIVGPERSIVVA